MANPFASQDATQTAGYANTVASVLGLNNWQLQAGSYNGVKFHLILSGVLDNLNRFNPAAGAISQINGLLSRANLIGGIVPATNDNLPYGTSTVSKNITDTGSRKFARHRIPNSSSNVLEDLGWDGEVIKCVGIIFGSSALDANNNLFNVMINPSSVSQLNRNVLVHPVLGKINNVLLTNYKRVHASEQWKAIAYEFTFETSSPILAQTSPLSTISKLAAVFNAITSIYTAINSSIQLATLLYTRGNVIVNSYFQTNYNNSIINAATLIGVTKLIYANLTPSGFVSPTLQALNTSTVNLSIGSTTATTGISNKTGTLNSNQTTTNPYTGVVNVNLSAFNTAFNTGLSNGVTQVISLYATSIQNTINVINSSGQNSVFQSVVANLEASLVALNNVGQSVLANLFSNSTTITTSTTTSLEEIFAKYNMNYNLSKNIQQVISMNQGSFNSVNYIPVGTKVILPNDFAQ